MTSWYVKLRFPNGYTEEFSLLDRRSLSIGRSGKSDICIPNPDLPEVHELLKRNPEDRHWRFHPIHSPSKPELIREKSFKIDGFEISLELKESKSILPPSFKTQLKSLLWGESKVFGGSLILHLLFLALVAPSFPVPNTEASQELNVELTKAQTRKLFPELIEKKPVPPKKQKIKVSKKKLTGKVLAKSGGQAGGKKTTGDGPKQTSGLLALDLSNLSPQSASETEDSLSFQVASSDESDVLKGFKMEDSEANTNENNELLAISGERGSGFRGLEGEGVALSPSNSPDLPLLPKSSDKKPDFITKITTKDGLEQSQIEAFVQAHLNEIEYCYEQALVENTEAQGRIETSWIIDETGETSKAQVLYSSVLNDNLQLCITTRISQWKFPEPLGGGIVRVRYPFILTPKGAQR